MDIRQTVRDELDRQGITQRELAARTKLTASRICDYLKGKRDMNGGNLERMLVALKIELTPPHRRRK